MNQSSVPADAMASGPTTVTCPYCGSREPPTEGKACSVCGTDLELICLLDDLGRCYHEAGRSALARDSVQHAVRNLTTAAEIQPENAQYMLAAARALERCGDHEPAHRFAAMVTERYPGNSEAAQLLRELDSAGFERTKRERSRRVRFAGIYLAFAILGAALVLVALWLRATLGPSPAELVLNALKSNPGTTALSVRASDREGVVELAGSVPGEAERARVLSVAASAGQRIDSRDLKADISNPRARVLNALSKVDPEIMDGLRWSEQGGILLAAGTVRSEQDLDALSRALGDAAQVGPTDLSAVHSLGRAVTVASGDTLWKIAERFYGTGFEYGKLRDAHGLPIRNPRRLRVGQVIYAPTGEQER
jgi:LysM repeat protein